jgi:hypothetical protein
MIRYAALLFAMVIVMMGVFGLAAPQAFLDAIKFFQAGQRIYLISAIRLVIGIVVFLAAPDARWPKGVRFAGGLVFVLGILTPIAGNPLPSVEFGWWAADFIRPWAFATILFGGFIIAAVVPPRQHED